MGREVAAASSASSIHRSSSPIAAHNRLSLPDNTQVGPGWLNPTEEGVWPLEETLQVADLAFQEFKTSTKSSAHGEAELRSFVSAVFEHYKLCTKLLLSCWR